MTVPPETQLLDYRLRIFGESEADLTALNSLTFVFIDPGETDVELLEQLIQIPEPMALSRTQWGCPDGEDSPAWPPTYTSVSHLLVHHTDTTNEATDWPAQVRSIWSYHTFTRGWGDIGYNYLIDPLGVIYVGRAGGHNALGAHFSCRNGGTQGIALLGRYSVSLPTVAALNSLEGLLAWIAEREGVMPLEQLFHDGTELTLNTISGHKDGNPSPHVCNSTECPGDAFYSLLSGVRANVASLLQDGGQAVTIFNDGTATLSVTSIELETSGPWISWNPTAPLEIPPGESRDVYVSVDFEAAPTGSSTRRMLVLSNDPDESPYPGGVNVNVETSAPQECFELSLNRTGSGMNPVASPSNSPGCPIGQYTANSSIFLSADPAAGWSVGSWSGTIDDNSTAEINSATMPATAHVVTVNYIQLPAPCFNLDRSHTGSGEDPIASPSNSAGCPDGMYREDEPIQVTAEPAQGWIVDRWFGTVNDDSISTTNTVIMPGTDHEVEVAYRMTPSTCYQLSLLHTGSGSVPTAWPDSTGNCDAGRYTAGSFIQVTAAPSAGWVVENWNGTDNNSSSSTTNTLTMPSSNHLVTANYIDSSEIIFTDGFESGDTTAWAP